MSSKYAQTGDGDMYAVKHLTHKTVYTLDDESISLDLVVCFWILECHDRLFESIYSSEAVFNIEAPGCMCNITAKRAVDALCVFLGRHCQDNFQAVFGVPITIRHFSETGEVNRTFAVTANRQANDLFVRSSGLFSLRRAEAEEALVNIGVDQSKIKPSGRFNG